MKSPVLANEEEFNSFCKAILAIKILKPQDYPCIVTASSDGALQEIIYYHEFQKWRYEVCS
jgi:hypothetical protein